MPTWEHYEVSAETKIKIRTSDGKTVAEFTTFGEAKGGSNEGVDPKTLQEAVSFAVNRAAASASEHASTARKNRRRELGYRDGN